MKLLVLKEKHGDRYFLYETTEELHQIAHYIIAERIANGCYEYDVNKRVRDDLERVTQGHDEKAAWRVLQSRRTWEYEGFDLWDAQTVKDLYA